MDRKNLEKNIKKVKSYANIAIIKYWGKKDAEKMIPATSSISLTLKDMYTETEISFISDEEAIEKTGEVMDLIYINGELQDREQRQKIGKVIDLFRGDRSERVKVDTTNSMPTEAGLSSSSSGLSAAIMACNELFEKNLSRNELAQISKFASGSSCRSFFGPVTAWDKDTGEVYKVKTNLKFGMIMLVLNDAKTFENWVKQSEIDFVEMKKYLAENDFEKVGKLTEENALRMHETPLTATPSFSYLSDKSHEAMNFVRNLRKNGEKCYFTMDAGPNVKVLCLEKDLDRLKEIFEKKYRVIASRVVELG